MTKFELVSKFLPKGDQPKVIDQLVDGLNDGLKEQVLLGVTGSGKTFIMANIINKLNRPALILAHNKTLASQLCNEFKEFFPNDRVEFFVSYYDYYQPEAYIASTDTYIEKDLSINDEIDRLRSSATASLFDKDKNVIIVSSVSCIYGLGNPEEYDKLAISLRLGDEIGRDVLIKKLVENQYERNDINFTRSTFRVRGDVIDIYPSYSADIGIRVELFGDEIDSIVEFNVTTGNKINKLKHAIIYPASHYAVGSEKLKSVLAKIKQDSEIEVAELKKNEKLIEAQRLRERVDYDLAMLSEAGYCSGIENYSRYFDGREIGEPPYTLLDYFPKDFILFVDESHITLPQIRAMYNGDYSRKKNLVEYGFRLKSAYDNRPLTFDEFNKRIGQVVYVSATPSNYELERADQVVECLIRPTGLLDPKVEVRKIEGQIDDLIGEIKKVVKNNGRVLVTTLTKEMSERLSNYLTEFDIKVKYLHSNIKTLERTKIINSLRRGEIDCIVGINLLREGLDIPEVQLVAILDADKEGFLRSTTSLIQTIGRASRNSESRVIMYADTITDSMKRAIKETERRRDIQNKYNIENNIIPKTIKKDIIDNLSISTKYVEDGDDLYKGMSIEEMEERIDLLKKLMKIASKQLDFEKAISLRDEIKELQEILYSKRR